MREAFSGASVKGVDSYDYYKYRISYTIDFDSKLMFIFVSSLTDSPDSIKKEILKCKKDFLNLFGDIIQHKVDNKTFEVFDSTIDGIHRNLRPKISLVGFSGVGKTTITKLIMAEEIPTKHVPTITGDIATIKIGKLHFHLWDFAGQEQFSYLWNNFIKGSDAVLLITDSSLENVEKSKFFLELIKEEAPNAHTAVIGNKQDLPEALKPENIEKILGLKTYSMIAKEPENRDKMIQIIADILEMSAEVSPLLKPLLDRDRLIEEAMTSLENTEFTKALQLFEKISDLCMDLGDDSLSREFYEKAQKIKQMLKVPIETKEKGSAEPIPLPEKPPTVEPVEVPKSTQALKPPSSPPIRKPPSESVVESKISEPSEIIQEKSVQKEKSLKTFDRIDSLEFPDELRAPEEQIDDKKKEKKEKKIEKKEKKKEKKEKKSKGLEEKIVEIPSIITTPSFLKSSESQVKSSDISQKAEIKSAAEASVNMRGPEKPWEPPNIRPFKKEQPKILSDVFKTEEEQEKVLFKPSIPQKESTLTLKPEDFIIKQSPKKVVSVPGDAKTKLKTSSFGHVVNPDETKSKLVASTKASKSDLNVPEPVAPAKLIKDKPKAPEPVAPTKLIKDKTLDNLVKPAIPTPLKMSKSPEDLKPEVVTETNSSEVQKTGDSIEGILSKGANKKELDNSLMELKIKRAQIQNMVLDFEMKELSGEITPEELKEKKMKLAILEKKIDDQINQIQNILNSLT